MAIGSILPSPSTTYFLNKGLKRFCHVEMNDAIKMFKVQSHSQSSCRNNDSDGFIFEIINNFGFFFIFESPMKNCCLNVAIDEEVEHFINEVFRSAINENSPASHDFQCIQILDQCIVLTFRANFSSNSNIKILIQNGR